MAYRVKAALATYRVAGQLLYGYEGAVLPDGVEKADIEHLLEADLIEKVKESKDPETKDANAAPAKNGSLEAWQDYAKSKGATDVDLDGKSRDDLVAAFGS